MEGIARQRDWLAAAIGSTDSLKTVATTGKAKKQARRRMPVGIFMDNFIKGCGVLFGFAQAPMQSSHRGR